MPKHSRLKLVLDLLYALVETKFKFMLVRSERLICPEAVCVHICLKCTPKPLLTHVDALWRRLFFKFDYTCLDRPIKRFLNRRVHDLTRVRSACYVHVLVVLYPFLSMS